MDRRGGTGPPLRSYSRRAFADVGSDGVRPDGERRLAAALRSGGKANESVAMLRALHSHEPAPVLALRPWFGQGYE